MNTIRPSCVSNKNTPPIHAPVPTQFHHQHHHASSSSVSVAIPPLLQHPSSCTHWTNRCGTSVVTTLSHIVLPLLVQHECELVAPGCVNSTIVAWLLQPHASCECMRNTCEDIDLSNGDGSIANDDGNACIVNWCIDRGTNGWTCGGA